MALINLNISYCFKFQLVFSSTHNHFQGSIESSKVPRGRPNQLRVYVYLFRNAKRVVKKEFRSPYSFYFFFLKRHQVVGHLFFFLLLYYFSLFFYFKIFNVHCFKCPGGSNCFIHFANAAVYLEQNEN